MTNETNGRSYREKIEDLKLMLDTGSFKDHKRKSLRELVEGDKIWGFVRGYEGTTESHFRTLHFIRKEGDAYVFKYSEETSEGYYQLLPSQMDSDGHALIFDEQTPNLNTSSSLNEK
jgi:hypothetical protein